MYETGGLNNFIHIGIVPILLLGGPFLTAVLTGNSAASTE
jgi:hypothetical protein